MSNLLIFILSICAVSQVYYGDLTTLPLDAIVSSSDRTLSMGGGVAHAIMRKAGTQLREARNAFLARQPQGVPQTHCWVSPGFGLPAAYILHTATPPPDPASGSYARSAGPFNELQQTFANVLDEANTQRLQTVAIPLLGAGIVIH